MTLVLHAAPDNASFPIRMVLEELGLPYRVQAVDRRINAHKSAEYRRLNPSGVIPALETSHGPIFETAAILLWLSEDSGRLGPASGSAQRGRFLAWMFFLSQGLHGLLRGQFYPGQYAPDAVIPSFRRTNQAKIREALDLLEADATGDWMMGNGLSVADFYLAAMLRWLQIYPLDDCAWFALSDWPQLAARSARLQRLDSVERACMAEGMGPEALVKPVPIWL